MQGSLSLQASRGENLRRLLKPRHLAVVGGREAGIVIRQCRSVGFQGEIWPVNPKRESIEGLPCYASLADLPEAPDAAFLGVPKSATVDLVGELSAIGAGGAVCYAAGFAEVGETGAALQRELVTAAGNLALVGPNCYGLLNYVDGAALWPEGHGGKSVERGVALVMQSGNIALNVTMQQRSLPLSYVISAGNQACLGLGDYVDALVEDPRVSAIGLYIEGLADIPGFARAAAKALARGVPLVALKTGKSEMAARFTLSHTSSLAGADSLYQALFDRLGVVRVHGLSSFLETLKLLSTTGSLPGRRLAVACCSGAEAALIADLAEEHGLELPALTVTQQENLKADLSDIVTLANPLDYNTAIWGQGEAMTRCFTALLQGPVDIGVLLLDYPHAGTPGYEAWNTAFDALAQAQEASGAVGLVLSTFPELLPEVERDAAQARGVVPLQGLEQGVEAIAGAAWYGEKRAQINNPVAAAALLAEPIREGPLRALDEVASKTLISEAGLTVPRCKVVAPDDAAAAAKCIGFPVVVKAVSAQLSHKSEAGAVALNLGDAAEVETAAARLAAILEAQGEAEPRLLVEEMVFDGVAEIILGVIRDPQFGLVLVIGGGGILVELLKDSRSLLLPCCREEIRAALQDLKIWPLLNGFRGRPAGDVEAVLDAAEALVSLAEAKAGELAELDINPLIVRPSRKGAVAADALVRLAGTEDESL